MMVFLALMMAAQTPAGGMPPLTAQTQRSGGPIDPDQAKLAFDHADLSFEIHPEKRLLSGIAAPMPIELSIDGAVRRVDMPDGRATLTIPAAAHIVIDPMARVLRRSIAVEQYQTWRDRQPQPK